MLTYDINYHVVLYMLCYTIGYYDNYDMLY